MKRLLKLETGVASKSRRSSRLYSEQLIEDRAAEQSERLRKKLKSGRLTKKPKTESMHAADKKLNRKRSCGDKQLNRKKLGEDMI